MLKQLRLLEDEPEPITTEAEIEMSDFVQRVDAVETEINGIKFTILVWGPSRRSQSAVAEKRREIHRELKEDGHRSYFSEEFKRKPGISLRAQELIQARESDIIFLLVEAHADGPIGEMHDFCSHGELVPKIVLYYPEAMEETYSSAGIVWELDQGFHIVRWYKEIDITSCRVLRSALECVQARRSYVYSSSKG